MLEEHEAKLRLTLERMRTEFAKGTLPAQAHEMARSMFTHNFRKSDDDEVATSGNTGKGPEQNGKT